MAPTQPLSSNFAESLASKLEDTEEYVKPRATPAGSAKVEPTMRALRRIIGDTVLEIFPEGFPEMVDNFYNIHTANPDKWDIVELGDEDERDDLLKLMRAYAECAGDKGYTVRQDRTADPSVLRFRVTVRRGTKEDADE
jgi:hypothetical protein